MEFTYDPACEELANHFLRPEMSSYHGTAAQQYQLGQKRMRELAQTIQDSIDEWLRMNPVSTGGNT